MRKLNNYADLHARLSHMSLDVSKVCIVGIFWTNVVEPLLCKFLDKEPECNASNQAFPHGLCNIVPHLVINSVDLLHPLEIVCRRWCVRESPHTQVVHVLESGPVVSERDFFARSEPVVVVHALTSVRCPTEVVSDPLRG